MEKNSIKEKKHKQLKKEQTKNENKIKLLAKKIGKSIIKREKIK